jgi:hypothetical protein
MHALKEFRHKHSTIFGAVAGVALATASAALAFFIYSATVGGSATSQFSGNSTISAITLAQTGSTPALNAGQAVTMNVLETDNDAANQHRILTLGATFTSKDSGGTDNTSTCGAHLSLAGSQGLIGSGFPAGGTNPGTVSIAADASTPPSCAGGSYTIVFNGTTD